MGKEEVNKRRQKEIEAIDLKKIKLRYLMISFPNEDITEEEARSSLKDELANLFYNKYFDDLDPGEIERVDEEFSSIV